MDKPGLDPMTPLEQHLKASANASRPTFSPELYERILSAVDDCDRQAILPPSVSFSGTRQLRLVMAIAASLLAIVGVGRLAGLWRVGGHWAPVENALTQDQPSANPSADLLVSNDADLIYRANMAADHWNWLDEDARRAALWFVDELPLDLDSSDGLASEGGDDEPQVGG